MIKITLTALLVAIASLQALYAQFRLDETTLDTATVITGIDIPWEIQWGPDNHIWTTERFGRVSRINPGTGVQDVILDLSETVYQSGESGLLGMVLHPDFDDEPYIYLAYTYKPGASILERVVRYEYNGESLVNEFILIDNIQGNTTHDGCRLIILPDYTLMFTTGDAQNQPAAQNLNHLSGKVLRLNLDGSVPDDNPYAGNPVFTLGHRNAQGLHLAPNGMVYSSEHGPSTDDELNIIEAGRNYGWPNVHGYCDLPSEEVFCEENNVKEPIMAWTPTVAASDLIYYDHPSIPEWQGHLLMTSLKNKRLYVMELDESGTSIAGEQQLFINWWGRLRDICMDPEGAIYLATNGPSWANTEPFTHSIVKIWNPEYVSVEDGVSTTGTSARIYPNPASEILHIAVETDSPKDLMVSVFSPDGRLMDSFPLDDDQKRVSLDNYRAGLYLITISSGGTVMYSDKFFVTR